MFTESQHERNFNKCRKYCFVPTLRCFGAGKLQALERAARKTEVISNFPQGTYYYGC